MRDGGRAVVCVGCGARVAVPGRFPLSTFEQRAAVESSDVLDLRLGGCGE